MKRHAARPPSVPRSRRDDRYDAGHATPIKRASSGWVQSVQDDTVTVVVLGQSLTGVIPLETIPPVGAVVEVEARGDLLVIPTWFEGPTPPPDVIVVELPAQNIGSDDAPTQAATIVGGPNALFTRGTDSYVRFCFDAGDYKINVGRNPVGGTPDVDGFGLFDLDSVGATIDDVTDVRFIAEGYLVEPGVPITLAEYEAWWGAGTTNGPLDVYPFLLIAYAGDGISGGSGYGSGYSIADLPTYANDAGECAIQLRHDIGGDDYVFAGIGTPDTGTHGLQPLVHISDTGTWGGGDLELILTYLAIQITIAP